MPYIVTYSVLHTLKKIVLEEFRRGPFKKEEEKSTITPTFLTLYCTLYGVIHTIWRNSKNIAYCKLNITQYTAIYSFGLFLQTQKCTVTCVLNNIYCAVQRVVCGTPYGKQYSILHTLTNFT